MSSRLLYLACLLYLNFPHVLYTWNFFLSSMYVNCPHVLYTKKGIVATLALSVRRCNLIHSRLFSSTDLTCPVCWYLYLNFPHVLLTWPVVMSWPDLSCMLASIPDLSSCPLSFTCPHVLTWPVLHDGLYTWPFVMSSFLYLSSCPDLTCPAC